MLELYNHRMTTNLTFAHVSDIHMRPEGMLDDRLDMFARANSVLDAVDALETPPAFMLITGDNIDEVEPDVSYRRLKQLLVRVKVPIIFALGNHDVRREFRTVFEHELAQFLVEPGVSDAPCNGKIVIGELRLLVLDSLVPGFAHGFVDAPQLGWLAGELDAPFAGKTILALHHCPLPIATTRFRNFQLTNTDAVHNVLSAARTKPLGVLFGHIHYSHVGLYAGIPCVSAPGIAKGIAPDAQRGVRLTDSLGFNVCHIIEDQFVVNPMMIQAETRTLTYDTVMAWQ